MKLRFSIRTLLGRLKRPQFSLLLMLLIIALFGTVFGWLAAVDRKRLLDYQTQKARIEEEIATIKKDFDHAAPSTKPIYAKRIAEAKKRIEKLSP